MLRYNIQGGSGIYDFDVDGRLQVTAGAILLDRSRLIRWDSDSARFCPESREVFENACKDIDSVFGRLVSWINFSAGAEMLVKGICLLHEVEIRSIIKVPNYPDSKITEWITEYVSNWKSHGILEVTNYGTLGSLWAGQRNNTVDPPLHRLFAKVDANQHDKDLLLAAYRFLATTIRNRDAHAYVPKVRDNHLSLVSDLFFECFNLLASWLPGGSVTLNDWRRDAEKFIAHL